MTEIEPMETELEDEVGCGKKTPQTTTLKKHSTKKRKIREGKTYRV